MAPSRTRLRVALAVAGLVGLAGTATAATQRTFVASTGSDGAPCSLAQPCRTFAAAIAQTLPGGEVIVLDGAGFGPFAINQPVTIIAPPGVYAGISVSSGAGITVNAGASGKVTLRGLTINGLGGTQGIQFNSGAALYVDNVNVSGFGGGGAAAGLAVAAAASCSVHVVDSTFRDNTTGASFAASAGTVTLTIERTLFERNGTGASFGDATVAALRGSTFATGGVGLQAVPATAGKSARVEVRDSVITDNATTGIVAGSVATAPAFVSVVSSLVSGNAQGIVAQATGNSAFVSDTTIIQNVTGVAATGGATLVSAADNQLLRNTTDGTFTSTVPRQ